ncbi:MAG: hypothetical protein E7365_01605 [Clostridiales bacterium]|nr:hypothetical protein [Clostridiales bacterium]
MLKLLNGDLYSYERLRFTGLNTQDILNISYKNGIIIKNAVRTEYAQMEADVYSIHVKKLKKLLGKNKYKISTIKKRGVFYQFDTNKNRIFLWVSLLMAFLGLCLFFSRTWSVKVFGYDQPEKIIQIVKNNNMISWKKGLNNKIEDLQLQILKSDDNILWSWVTVNGTNIEVYVKKDETLKLPENKQGNLYASKDCVIRNLVVLGGTGKVENGKTVKKGDILIEATQKIGEEFYPVNAQGKAVASVYYSSSQTVPVKSTVYTETGNKKNICRIRFLGMDILAGGKNEFVTSNKTEQKINTFGLPIDITKIIYSETQGEIKTVDNETLVNETQAQLITFLKQQMPENAVVHKTETTVTENDDSLTVHVYIETVEDVAVRG